MLEGFIGPTKTIVAAETLQVENYEKYSWTMFVPEARKARHDAEFPGLEAQAFAFGAAMARGEY